jgi:hypothetical protein
VPPSTDPESSAGPPPPPPPLPEPRQRWRIVFRRGPLPADQVGRAAIEGWQAAVGDGGLLPALPDAAGRPRIAFGAPLPATAAGEAELAEIWLTERVPLWRLREVLGTRLPPGHDFVSAEDTWLGGPSLAGRVVAADWRIRVVPAGADVTRLTEAAERLLAAATLPRIRAKAGGDRPYDLRPLLLDLRAATSPADSAATIHVRTRIHPELGSGRPDEVVAALADATGAPLEIVSIIRERLLLAEDLPADQRIEDVRPPAQGARPGRPGRSRPR